MRDFTTYSYSKGYSLSLSDGNNWWITSDEYNTNLLDELAVIMQLSESQPNGLPKLVFSRMNEKNDVVYSETYSSDAENKYLDYIFVHTLHSNNVDVICEVKDNLNSIEKYYAMWNSITNIFMQSIKMGGLPFHTGLAEYKGHAVLFAAKGGTGKSTCCNRLPDYWKRLCDDKALVVLDKSRGYVAHPFPTWSDYMDNRAENTWDVQYSVPVSAIFFLEQSKSDEVIPLSKEQSSILITDAAFQALENIHRYMANEKVIMIKRDVFNNAFEMAKVIPAFRLRLSLNGRFWEEIEKVISL
jgi:SynChlorMet cassette protein ScmC